MDTQQQHYQDLLLKAIEDPGAAKILAEIWTQIEGEPLMASRMVRAFQSGLAIIREATKEIPAHWKELEEQLTRCDLHRAQFTQDLRDFRNGTTAELAASIKDLGVLEEFFEKLNDDEFMNKANRVLELCDRLTKARRDGTLDWLVKVIGDTKK